jgi:outer membrane lipoprotein-sorting protein
VQPRALQDQAADGKQARCLSITETSKWKEKEKMVRSLISAVILSLFLSTGAIAAEFSADVVTESMAGTSSGKIYFKNDDISRTEMMGMISIFKRPLIYQLFANTQKYVVRNTEEAGKKNPVADAANFREWIDNNNMKKVGSETRQGYRCDIFEGDVKVADDQPPVHMKVWHTQKLGYPLRQESTLPPPVGNVSSHLENIQIGSQAGSLFEVPAGYTQAKDVQEAMGVGAMPSLGDSGRGQAPSQEEIQKMMKEMMKRMEKQ